MGILEIMEIEARIAFSDFDEEADESTWRSTMATPFSRDSSQGAGRVAYVCVCMVEQGPWLSQDPPSLRLWH